MARELPESSSPNESPESEGDALPMEGLGGLQSRRVSRAPPVEYGSTSLKVLNCHARALDEKWKCC